MEKKKNVRSRKPAESDADSALAGRLPGFDSPGETNGGERLCIPPEHGPEEAALLARLKEPSAASKPVAAAEATTAPLPFASAGLQDWNKPAEAMTPASKAETATTSVSALAPEDQPPVEGAEGTPSKPQPAASAPDTVRVKTNSTRPSKNPAAASAAAGPAAKVKSGAKAWFAWRPAALGAAAGAVLMAVAAVFWIAYGPQKREAEAVKTAAGEEIRKLQAELETVRMEASNLRTGSRGLSTLLAAFSTDWDKPPEKPCYQKVSDGVLIYWEDKMIWRKYYLYQGKGEKGTLTRYNPRPQKRGFVYLADPTPGIWRFSVSALNKEGRETLPSEVLTLRIPLD